MIEDRRTYNRSAGRSLLILNIHDSVPDLLSYIQLNTSVYLIIVKPQRFPLNEILLILALAYYILVCYHFDDYKTLTVFTSGAAIHIK